MSNLYLYLDLICIGFPLILSFDKNVKYIQNWKHAFIAILFTCAIFIPWDMFFTLLGVWGFNSDYLTGVDVGNLPIEEVLFFVTVPFACIFIYECVRYYLPKVFTSNYFSKNKWIYLITIECLLALMCYWTYGNYYTTTVLLLSLIIIPIAFIKWSKRIFPFLISYLFVCIPFLIINGVLTGGFTDEPIVWYNSEEIINLRIGTIPVEDFFYNFLMLVTSFGFYELSRKLRRS